MDKENLKPNWRKNYRHFHDRRKNDVRKCQAKGRETLSTLELNPPISATTHAQTQQQSNLVSSMQPILPSPQQPTIPSQKQPTQPSPQQLTIPSQKQLTISTSTLEPTATQQIPITTAESPSQPDSTLLQRHHPNLSFEDLRQQLHSMPPSASWTPVHSASSIQFCMVKVAPMSQAKVERSITVNIVICLGMCMLLGSYRQ